MPTSGKLRKLDVFSTKRILLFEKNHRRLAADVDVLTFRLAAAAVLIDFPLCLQELLNFTRCVFSALCFALGLCTLFFFTPLSLKFGLCSPSSFAVEKSLPCVHQAPFLGALIFSISQKYALAHIVYIGLIRFTAVEPQEGDAVSCGKAADDQCHDCYLLLPNPHDNIQYFLRGDYTVAMGGGAVQENIRKMRDEACIVSMAITLPGLPPCAGERVPRAPRLRRTPFACEPSLRATLK